MNANSNVVEMFKNSGAYKGENRLGGYEDRIKDAGMSDIKAMRERCFNVSNFQYYLMLGTTIGVPLISALISIHVGVLEGTSLYTSVIGGARMFAYQAMLLICGTIIGLQLAQRQSKFFLVALSSVLGILLFGIMVMTSVMWLFYNQAGAASASLNFFEIMARFLSMEPTTVALIVNATWGIIYEICVILVPIILEAVTCPAKEQKLIDQRILQIQAQTDMELQIVNDLADIEHKKSQANANLFLRDQERRRITNKANMESQLKAKRDIEELWMSTQPESAQKRYRKTGEHNTPDELYKAFNGSLAALGNDEKKD